MIDEQQRTRIRQLHYAEHWPVGTIAAELGLHHDTVRRALGERSQSTTLLVPPSKLDPYKAFIERTLKEHPRLRATRLFAMVKARGYDGSVVVVRRYVRKIRPAQAKEAFLRLSTMPGEQGQVDWGSFGKVDVGHARRSLSCFVMVLGESRALFARFYYDQQLENFLRAHTLAFEAFGGVPRELLYDNLKSVVLERVGEHIRFHDKLLELAGHYHFAPKPCAPYRANEKGKVERAIQYLRHSFFAARTWTDLNDLNAQLAAWIDEVAHRREVPGDPRRRTVAQALHEERPRLLPLPEHPFSCDLVKPVRVGKTPYIRFDLNDYSVPAQYVRRTLSLLVSDVRVRLTHQFTVVADHPRSFDRGQVLDDPEHLAELHRQKRNAAELRGRDRLRTACRNADAFIAALSLRGSALGVEVTRLLRLLDRYGVEETDAALATALERQALSASSVAYILDQRARARGRLPPLEVVLPNDPRVRDLEVLPHDLAAYDDLGNDDDDHHET